MFTSDTTDYDKTRFVLRSGRDFQQVRVVPQFLSINEIDPVFDAVSCAFPTVKLESHEYRKYTFTVQMESALPPDISQGKLYFRFDLHYLTQ